MAIKLNSKDLQSGSLNGKSLSEVWLNNQKIYPEEKVVIPPGDPIGFNIYNLDDTSYLTVKVDYEGTATNIIGPNKNDNIVAYSGHQLMVRFTDAFKRDQYDRDPIEVLQVRFDANTYGKITFGDIGEGTNEFSSANVSGHIYYKDDKDFTNKGLDPVYSSIAVISIRPNVSGDRVQKTDIEFFIQFDLEWNPDYSSHTSSTSDFIFKANIISK